MCMSRNPLRYIISCGQGFCPYLLKSKLQELCTFFACVDSKSMCLASCLQDLLHKYIQFTRIPSHKACNITFFCKPFRHGPPSRISCSYDKNHTGSFTSLCFTILYLITSRHLALLLSLAWLQTWHSTNDLVTCLKNSVNGSTPPQTLKNIHGNPVPWTVTNRHNWRIIAIGMVLEMTCSHSRAHQIAQTWWELGTVSTRKCSLKPIFPPGNMWAGNPSSNVQ